MTTYQLVLASELAYLNDVSQADVQALGWKPITTLVNGDTGYAGVAFLTPDNEVVVAHAGTHFGGTGAGDLEDDVLLGLNRIPTQFEDAKRLMQETQQYLQEKSIEATVHHTGYSLGGSLAQMCAHQYDQKATTFEAPATKEILEKMNVGRPIDPSDFDLYAVRGSWISSEHSIVPHSHVSEQVNYLDLELPDDLYKFGLTGKDTFSFDFHSLDNFKHGIAENGNILSSYHNPVHLNNLLEDRWAENTTWGYERDGWGTQVPISIKEHFGDFDAFKKYYLETNADKLGLPATAIEFTEGAEIIGDIHAPHPEQPATVLEFEGSEIVVDKNLWMEIQLKIQKLEAAVDAI